MNGIFYFSSTGNSLDIAQRIKHKLGGHCHYIPQYSKDASEYDQLIVVSPVYSWGLPRHTDAFLRTANTKAPLYIVLNYGGFAAGAPYYAYKTALEYGLHIRGVYRVKMPENYTLSFNQPAFMIRSVLKKSVRKIDKIVRLMADGKAHIVRRPVLSLEKQHLKNREKWSLLAKDFTVNNNCTHCGKCIQICPVGNIFEKDGKISFKDQCVACLGCYHRCPQKAINYQDKTQGRARYINPNVCEKDITPLAE